MALDLEPMADSQKREESSSDSPTKPQQQLQPPHQQPSHVQATPVKKAWDHDHDQSFQFTFRGGSKDSGDADVDVDTMEEDSTDDTSSSPPPVTPQPSVTRLFSISRKITTPFNTGTKPGVTAAQLLDDSPQQQQHQESVVGVDLRANKTSDKPGLRRLSSSMEDLHRLHEAAGGRDVKIKQLPSAHKYTDTLVSRSTMSLKSSRESIKNFFGSVRKKLAPTHEPAHICKPVAEGMSRCRCGRSW